MSLGIINLIKAKWGSGTGRQVIVKSDFADIETAVLQSFGLQGGPKLEWIDATAIKVPATADEVAAVMLNGFPSQIHRRRLVTGDLTDGRYRENTTEEVMDFDLAAKLWGTEKASQWYTVYALAGATDTAFTLKSMPYMRVKSQASQVISLGSLVTPATGIGYGFATDALAGGKLYFLSGASLGLVRPITANNNDNGTGGAITYGGSALTLAQGDWFIVLPPATNFRRIGDIFNDASSNIQRFEDHGGGRIQWLDQVQFAGSATLNFVERINACSPLATELRARDFEGAAWMAGWTPAGLSSNLLCKGAGYSDLDFPVKNCSFFLEVASAPSALSYICPG